MLAFRGFWVGLVHRAAHFLSDVALPRPAVLHAVFPDGSTASRAGWDGERCGFPLLVLLEFQPNGRHWSVRTIPAARPRHLRLVSPAGVVLPIRAGTTYPLTRGTALYDCQTSAYLVVFPGKAPSWPEIGTALAAVPVCAPAGDCHTATTHAMLQETAR